MASIGIKLADGSFYPILEEGSAENKVLELTTVQDNQTTVQIDLYRSSSDSIDEAEYVDTLEIRALKPHPNGEPNLRLNISIDENNQLKAEVMDPETGKMSETETHLVSRTLSERNAPVNFSIDNLAPKAETLDEDLSESDPFAATIANDLPVNFDSENIKNDDIEESEVIIPSPNDEDFSFDGFDEGEKKETPETSPDEIQEGDLIFDDSMPSEQDTITEDEIDFGAFENAEESLPEDFIEEPADEGSSDLLTGLAAGAAIGAAAVGIGSALANKEDSQEIIEETEENSVPEGMEAVETVEESDSSSIDDLLNSTLEDEPAIEEDISVPLTDEPSFEDTTDDISIATDAIPSPEDITYDLAPGEMPQIEEEASLELPDFGESESVVEESAEENNIVVEADSNEESLSDFNFEETAATEEALSNASDIDIPAFDMNEDSEVELPDFGETEEETAEVTESTESLNIPDFGDTVEGSDTSSDDLDISSLTEGIDDEVELPDFGETVEETAEADFGDTVEGSDTSSDDLDISSLTEGIDDEVELPDFGETVEETAEVTDTSATESDALPDFGDTFDSVSSSETSDTSFDLPDFGETESSSQDMESIASESVPDFGDDFENDLDSTLDTAINSTSDSMFNTEDATFVPRNSMFDNLYDKETIEGKSASYEEPENKDSKKTRTHVIICLICAIICILATLLVLFVIPSKLNIKFPKKDKPQTPAPVEIVEPTIEITEEEPIEEAPKFDISFDEPLPDPEPEADLTIETQAKEDEIVVATVPEAVIPEQPSEPAVKPEDIRYKIVWGDTLWDIADAYYKNPWKYKFLATYNGIRNPNHIISGTWILIPAE